jgi:hypothetical protein
MIRRDGAHRRGGSLGITDNNTLRYRTSGKFFDYHETTEIVPVEIFSKDVPLIVASCHNPPTNNPIDRNDCYRFFAQFEGLLVIGGEFYVHNIE